MHVLWRLRERQPVSYIVHSLASVVLRFASFSSSNKLEIRAFVTTIMLGFHPALYNAERTASGLRDVVTDRPGCLFFHGFSRPI